MIRQTKVAIGLLVPFLISEKYLIYTQINSFTEPKLSKYLAGVGKNHNIQHALLKTTETWRSMLNKGHNVGVIVMDLSKLFDTLNHKLLLCELKACDTNALI